MGLKLRVLVGAFDPITDSDLQMISKLATGCNKVVVVPVFSTGGMSFDDRYVSVYRSVAKLYRDDKIVNVYVSDIAEEKLSNDTDVILKALRLLYGKAWDVELCSSKSST